MKNREIKNEIDQELSAVKMDSVLKENIRLNVEKRPRKKYFRIPAAVLAALVLCTMTAFAGYYVYNAIRVNDEVIPELDSMKVVKVGKIQGNKDEDGFITKEYESYDMVNEELGTILLDSKIAENQEYMKAVLDTDNKDYITIHVYNYIIGDVTEIKRISDYDYWYSFTPGEIYQSPISMDIDIILSEEQLKNGMELDYLGMYQYQESYISQKGYKVNIISSDDEENVDNEKSEKYAVFVVDGIRYQIHGCVSTEKMKEIVDSME